MQGPNKVSAGWPKPEPALGGGRSPVSGDAGPSYPLATADTPGSNAFASVVLRTSPGDWWTMLAHHPARSRGPGCSPWSAGAPGERCAMSGMNIHSRTRVYSIGAIDTSSTIPRLFPAAIDTSCFEMRQVRRSRRGDRYSSFGGRNAHVEPSRSGALAARAGAARAIRCRIRVFRALRIPRGDHPADPRVAGMSPATSITSSRTRKRSSMASCNAS